MRTILQAALAVLLSWSASVHAFEFAGIAIGKPGTPELVWSRLNVNCGFGAIGQVCNGKVDFEKESARVNLVIGDNGIVQRINLSFSPGDFETTEAKLIRQFGKPYQTQRSVATNRFGVSFQQVKHAWVSKEGNAVILTKYDGAGDSSTLYFSTPEDRKLLMSAARGGGNTTR